MDKGVMKNFLNISQIDPPKGLCEKILVEIERKKIRSARIWLGFWSVAFSGLFAFLVSATQNTLYKISQSGFSKYLSLIFSDWDIILSSWKEFVLSIVESMPLLEITATLSIVLILLVVLKLLTKNTKAAFLPTKLI